MRSTTQRAPGSQVEQWRWSPRTLYKWRAPSLPTSGRRCSPRSSGLPSNRPRVGVGVRVQCSEVTGPEFGQGGGGKNTNIPPLQDPLVPQKLLLLPPSPPSPSLPSWGSLFAFQCQKFRAPFCC
eukprot:Hpha_TRINITY_DN15513_c7_g1::TRINITY_DN15513_c7_g1_i1::g.107639::m.107639